jgi:DNA-binding beta-propeller fold protein YncE
LGLPHAFSQSKATSIGEPDPNAERILETQKVERLLPRLSDPGAAMFFLAGHYVQLGSAQKAIDSLKACVSREQGFDPADVRAFQALSSSPEFRRLVEQVRRRYPPVHHARVAFTVQEADLFPEGLAADPERKLLYMGSMHRKKIIKITQAGEVSDFVSSDLYHLMPVGGVKVDPVNHHVWAVTDPGEENRSELVHFDSGGKLLERFPAPGAGPHDLNDLVLRNQDEIYVTDTFGHRVYRFDRKARDFRTVAFPRPLLYPNGITVSGDTGLLYVADLLGVIQVDLRNGSAREVNPGKHSTLAGIDGLYWYKGSLVGVQYGTGSHRVARWTLSSDGLRVTSTSVLEYRSPLVSFPTTGAIVGQSFYYIANTGIGNLKDDTVVDVNKLEPVHIAVVPLK